MEYESGNKKLIKSLEKFGERKKYETKKEANNNLKKNQCKVFVFILQFSNLKEYIQFMAFKYSI